jgi:hypothetical protein
MGVDAYIYFEQVGDLDFRSNFPCGYFVEPASLSGLPFVTHEVVNYSSFYNIGYERGCWADICAVLMLLHACPGVGLIWYFGDCDKKYTECTIDDVLRISKHFMSSKPKTSP